MSSLRRALPPIADGGARQGGAHGRRVPRVRRGGAEEQDGGTQGEDKIFFKKKQLGKRTLPASDVGAGETVFLRQVMLFIQREKNNLPYYFVLYCRAKKCFLQFYYEILTAHLSWSFCHRGTVIGPADSGIALEVVFVSLLL